MCVFVNEIRVSDTSIFARRPDAGDPRQLLVYSMEVYSNEPTAMILPLPVIPGEGEESIRFIDLSGYPDFFDDMRSAVHAAALAFGAGCVGEGLDEAPLPVHQVGDFEASYVPQLEDFKRLDPRFQLPDNVWAAMPDYHDYGFAVFQLNPVASMQSRSRTIHPMAFEFRSRDTERLFFPTVHVHDGQYHERAWFDHALFMQFESDTVIRSTITRAHNRMYEGDATEDDIVGDFMAPPKPEPEPEPAISDDLSGDLFLDPLPDSPIRSGSRHFKYSSGNASNYMNMGKTAGLINPMQRLCQLTAKVKLKNQDTWV